MAKPRVFVSSTYYDLRHIRRNIEIFIEEMGYEPILFESGDIPFEDKVPLDISCYREIENCHIQILIIGGRYGSPSSDSPGKVVKSGEEKHFEFYNSISKEEYIKSWQIGIPVFIFVQKGVLAEFETYKKNRDNPSINYAHVDSINIFKLIDEIYLEKAGNYVKDFENFDEIQNWLKEQWAGIFANYLSRQVAEQQIKTLSTQINELSVVVSSLREYSEAMMRTIKPENYERIIKEQEDKLALLTKFNELLEIEYVRHLTATHSIDIQTVHDGLLKSATYDEFKGLMQKVVDKPLKCIDRGFNIRDINAARKLLGQPEYDVKITEKDFDTEKLLDELIELRKSMNDKTKIDGDLLSKVIGM